MKHFLLFIFIFVNTIFAQVINEFPSQKLLDSKIKIIDIRTAGEWKELGLLKGSIPITFFDERANFDVAVFMMELKKHVKEGETFALICHVGSRTSLVAQFLSEKYNMNVINLKGGILYAKDKHLKILPYQGR